MIVYLTMKTIEPGVIPRVVRPVGISWYNLTCSGKLAIEETAYYEIATPLTGLAMTQRYDTLCVSKINSNLARAFCCSQKLQKENHLGLFIPGKLMEYIAYVGPGG